jgi:membrane-associated protease RseP (regulator of RpoE activity)
VGEVTGGAEARVADVNPLLPPGRVRLGIHLDQAFAGPGVRVSKVVEESPAAAAGIRAGDVLTSVDETETPDFRALRGALGKKKHGEAFRVTVVREERKLTLEGAFAKAEPEPAFRRGEPWGSIEALARGNAFTVTSAGIGSFDLYLRSELDVTEPVTVTVNGAEVFRAVVAPDLAFLLEMAGRDDDRTMLYLAKVRVEVPAK